MVPFQDLELGGEILPGDGIEKDRNGNWGVNLSYTNSSGEFEFGLISSGDKPMTLQETVDLAKEQQRNLQAGLEMGTIKEVALETGTVFD